MTRPTDIPDMFSRQALEFGAVIEMVGGHLSGPLSLPALATVEPSTDAAVIHSTLALAGEAREYFRDSSRPSLGALKDPRPILDKLSVEGASASALEILAVVEVARAARDIRGLFSKTRCRQLDELAAGIADFRELLSELEGKILPDGTVDSSASPELARIRRSIERLRHEIQVALERLVRRLGQDKVLQDALVTIRNDRFVIPVRAEEKRRVDGIVHGASASGATLYLEPLETVPLNNELVELEDREFAEIQRILAEFSARLRDRGADLVAATEILSEIDLAFAKAAFAREYDCCLPEVTSMRSSRTLELDEVRHPLLERALRGRNLKPVPISIVLREPKTLMVISGPNTGGKTVALKTIGMAALMAQAGLPVAARAARLPLFGRVLADIGDLQSIEANLSTFSAHIKNIQSMIETGADGGGGDDLVLLDEMGASTDPHEGAALAVAILEHFRERGAMTFVTTHQSRLKAWAADTPAAVNAATEFDEATLQPTYRILVGLPGKSSGLDIAARLGLDPAIVAQARTLLDPAEAEVATLLATLHAQKTEFERKCALADRERAQLDLRRQELEREFQVERRARLKELDQRLERTLGEYEKKWETTVAELRAHIQARNATAKLGKRIEKQGARLESEARSDWDAQVLEALGEPADDTSALRRPESEGSGPLAVGDLVRVDGLPASTAPGRVAGFAGDDQVDVEVGRLRMRVPKSEVRVVARAGGAKGSAGFQPTVAPGFRPAPAALKDGATYDSDAEAPAEINVIGATAEEARDDVDKFLDQAFVARRFRLRVIHGHGKGILRRTLHEMFASHPHVEKFYAAPPNEGGTGATIVELKL
ncbi:MAG TPA: Smr/MutS family protein [Terriglobia bacterium]|nr:Smr/MutS family protein [Terriglobia bacterium]